MKFSINQKELDNLLSICGKGVSPHASMPALAGVLVDANENEITVRSTNLELSIQASAPALIEEDGSCLIPARLFSDIVKALPNEAVSISSDNATASITCGKSQFEIRVMNYEDFPEFPQVEATQSVELPFGEFSAMTKKVARMVSRDESRAILQGVHVTVNGGKIEMVATDAYRIAVAGCEAAGDAAQVNDFSAVIPGKFLMDVASLGGDIKNAQVSLSENQVVIAANDVVFINRRIDGRFPGYEQLLPESPAVVAKVNRAALSEATRRIGVVNINSPVAKLVFDGANGTVKLSGNAQDVGSVEEELECEFEGDIPEEPAEIAFNCNYLTEGLGSLSGEKVIVEVEESVKPGIFKDEDGKTLYILLPVKLA